MLERIMTAIADFLWGWPLIIGVLGCGLVFTVTSGAFQFTYFGTIMKQTFGSLWKKQEEKAEGEAKGVLSAFQAISIAIGGTVGAGNIGGVATAIAVGGPGAVFWMWIAALGGMLIKMVEVTLAVHYRQKDEEGLPFGGPMYYIHEGLGIERKMAGTSKILNFLFISCMLVGVLVTMQCYNVSEALSSTFKVNQSLMAVIYTVLVYVMIAGGLRKLGQIASRLVPFMCVLYVVAGLGIILSRIDQVGTAFSLILSGAFSGTAATGGFAGAAVAVAIKKGLARAVFSNEAGWGTSPMIHSTATTDHPVRQGMWGVFEVFVDTIIVCSITALCIVMTGQWSSGLKGATLTLSAFKAVYGNIGQILLTVSLFLFGITTTTGWYTYYDIILRYVLREKVELKHRILTAYKWFYPIPGLALVLYAAYRGMPADIVWVFADVASGAPTFINLFAILLLTPKFLELLKDFKARHLGVGKIDPNCRVFFENGRKEK